VTGCVGVAVGVWDGWVSKVGVGWGELVGGGETEVFGMIVSVPSVKFIV